MKKEGTDESNERRGVNTVGKKKGEVVKHDSQEETIRVSPGEKPILNNNESKREKGGRGRRRKRRRVRQVLQMELKII